MTRWLYLFLALIWLLPYECICQSAIKDKDTLATNSSYVVLPSALGPDKGQMILENINLGYFGVDYGLSKHLSLKASFELFNPIFADQHATLLFQPKIRFKILENLHVAATYTNINAFDDGKTGILHWLGTYGSKSNNLSVGYGRVYYGFYGVNAQFNGLSFSGLLELNDKWSLISDNWLLFHARGNEEANRFNFHSLGVRTKIREKYQLDFGLTYFTESEDLGKFPWPFIKVAADIKSIIPHLKTRKPKKPEVKEVDTNKKKKVIYAELVGIGFFYSVNYDFRLSRQSNGGGFGLRVGASVVGALSVPIQLNYLIGGEDHYLEFASGITFASSNFDLNHGTYGSANASVSSSIAYRYQPANHGFFLRLSADLFYNYNLDDFVGRRDKITPWGGVGFGYSFR